MKINLITFKLKDTDTLYLKNISKSIFNKTNNPSFNIIEPIVILGKTTLSSFDSVTIDFIEESLVFDDSIQSKDKISFIASNNSSFINTLRDNLCDSNEINFNSKYFNLLKEKQEYPLIQIGGFLQNQIKVDRIVIKDFRLEILEIKIEDNTIQYKSLDTIHLSKDKVL
jgi:hypothetical protein